MQIFNLSHQKFGVIRAVILNGNIYLLGKDAADSLGFKDTSQAIRQHVQAKDKFTISDLAKMAQGDSTLTGEKVPHNAIWINESGLNALVLKAKVPFAQSFRTWVLNPDSNAEPDIFYSVHAQLISKYVYVLEMDDGTVKIGIAKNIQQRLSGVQRESGAKVLNQYVSKVIDEKLAAEIETKCHAAFEDKRAHGEYFNITFEDACAELDKYAAEIDAANAEIEDLINIEPPAPAPQVPETELSRLDKIKILRELLEFTDCKNIRNRLITDIAYLVTNKNY